MERKTIAALIIIACLIVALVAVIFIYWRGERNYARDYILSELGGDIVECTIEGDAHVCHVVYKENNTTIGEIWIYYYPGGKVPYKEYTVKVEAEQMISSKDVSIFLRGTQKFRENACDLYNKKFGFHCGLFERKEK